MERWVTADVPFTVIVVPFRREAAASSAGSVSFCFIHTNVMPAFWNFPVSPEANHALRPAHKTGRTLTMINGF
jgi:hypothetical protein